MSQLVPVIKMVFAVARYSLTFDVRGQTQLCKNERGDTLKTRSSSGQLQGLSLTERYVVLQHLLDEILRSTDFWVQKCAMADPVWRKIQQQVSLLQLRQHLEQFLLCKESISSCEQ